jgi:hypothetical protein
MDAFPSNPKPLPAPPLDSEAALDLTQAILTRTSGSSCGRLRDLACAYVDGELDEGQANLIQSHLDHCPVCASLVAALSGVQRVLPALAQLDPGPWFTQRVLRATVHRPPQRRDLREAWRKLMHRPRIALEAAYLGAAASLMGVYLPIPSVHATVRVPALAQPLGDSVHRVVGQVVEAERRTSGSLRQTLRPATTQDAPKSWWRRMSARVQAWFRGFHTSQPTPPQPEEKQPPPANP